LVSGGDGNFPKDDDSAIDQDVTYIERISHKLLLEGTMFFLLP